MTFEFEAELFADVASRGLVADIPERMAGGRSNHVWRAGQTVIKAYQRSSENPLFANDSMREQTSLKALAGTGMAPHFLAAGSVNGSDWLAYSHIEGAVWKKDTRHVAQLLGRLHDHIGFDGLPKGRNGSVELADQTLEILEQCNTPNPLLGLAPMGQVAAIENPVLIHGDPVPGNIVEHDGTLTLIDWQCPQLGDPAEDLALFLSPAMQLLYRGKPLTQDEENAFLNAYPDRAVVARLQALKPWFHWRMAAYCFWRSEQGSSRDHDAMVLELAALQSINPSAA
ncbi:phosphotransferase family protein [Parasedimentitalea denitrificans]|nr:phosphotransferase [Sedimentitalea sp. CY04]